jgi:pimeloyl-ACP methyl ester carboxylesterase/lysophospholipase L1-like esterase
MGTLFQKDGSIPHSKRIVFLGDSITDNGLYIAFIEAYFLQHMPEKELTFINLGVSSETVSGLSEEEHPWPRPCLHDRIGRALLESKPDWVVLCYGMNDGIYHPFSNERFAAFQEGIQAAIRVVKQSAEKIIVLTPPPYDHLSKLLHMDANAGTDSGCSWKTPDLGYNEVLRRYADWILSLPGYGVVDTAVNIYDPIMKGLELIRMQEPEYVYGDGIHPNARGHWIIAKTLLSRLFNITLERVPEYVDNTEAVPWIPGLLQRHRLLSAAWKEHVGHTNPNKAEVLPLMEALRRGEFLRREIISEASSAPGIGKSVNLQTSDWNGYERFDFYLDGREAIVVAPKQAASGRPWLWRTEFFGAFDYADRELLKQGWHIAYIRLSHMYGCPFAIRSMEGFRAYLTEAFELASRAVLFGFSRGGLYAVNYAAAYPNSVLALYLDAPVLDMRSWPGGKGKGTGSPGDWEDCLAVYGMTEEEAMNADCVPLNRAGEKLAASGIPTLLVAGDADSTVPYCENGEKLEHIYQREGGTIQVIVKKGIGHHPHSLENPLPIVQFIQNTNA